MGKENLNLTGMTFGRLQVVGSPKTKRVGNQSKLFWTCRCICGVIVEVPSQSLRSGVTKSCGCLKKELMWKAKTRKSYRSYNSWRAMKSRCTNPNDSHFKYYGGRGITFCKSWESFDKFFDDMGERGVDETLDRIDTEGNYSKDNCKWSGFTEQSYNSSLSRQINLNTSGKVGVRELKSGNWGASIGYMGRSLYLGTFKVFEDAVAARNKAEIFYYGKTKV